MPRSPQYIQAVATYWVRVVTNRLNPEGVQHNDIYVIEEYLDQSGLRHGLPSLKIRAPSGNLVGLMFGESEAVRETDEPHAPNLPPLRENLHD